MAPPAKAAQKSLRSLNVAGSTGASVHDGISVQVLPAGATFPQGLKSLLKKACFSGKI
jgi:hypothetical protein